MIQGSGDAPTGRGLAKRPHANIVATATTIHRRTRPTVSILRCNGPAPSHPLFVLHPSHRMSGELLDTFRRRTTLTSTRGQPRSRSCNGAVTSPLVLTTCLKDLRKDSLVGSLSGSQLRETTTGREKARSEACSDLAFCGVGDRGFEPLTSSVSRKRSSPELIARPGDDSNLAFAERDSVRYRCGVEERGSKRCEASIHSSGGRSHRHQVLIGLGDVRNHVWLIVGFGDPTVVCHETADGVGACRKGGLTLLTEVRPRDAEEPRAVDLIDR